MEDEERAVDSRFEMRVSATSKDRTVPGPYKENRKVGGKGRMARRLVYYCIGVLTLTAIWAAVIVTVAVALDRSIDLSAVLTFIGGAFGGELLLLLLKRVFAKPKDDVE